MAAFPFRRHGLLVDPQQTGNVLSVIAVAHLNNPLLSAFICGLESFPVVGLV
jgi:hypothetical protein